MIIETNSEKETYAFGLELGKKAHAGQVYTLVGKQSDIYNCTGI